MHAHPVAEVELLHLIEGVLADHDLGDEQLDVDASIGERGEHELAGVALEHHASGDRHLVGCLHPGFERAPVVTNLGNCVCAVKAVGVRVLAVFAQLVDARQPSGPLGAEPAAVVGDRFIAGVGGR